jgi:hypothetical protein
MATIAVYNFQPSNANDIAVIWIGGEVLIWRFIFHFTFNSTLCLALFTLRSKEVVKYKRRVYFAGGIYMAFYVLFDATTLLSESANNYIAKTNSVIWGAFLGSLALLLLILQLYDTRRS